MSRRWSVEASPDLKKLFAIFLGSFLFKFCRVFFFLLRVISARQKALGKELFAV
jgi:hypothetical protein